MCNTKTVANTEINLRITDLILTPATCALLLNEALKYLVYQKSQIPYPYAWLKTVVCRRRRNLESGERPNAGPSVSRNFMTAATAYDCIEDIMKNTTIHFMENGNEITELSVVFGVTPHSPKEIIRFLIPKLEDKHIDVNHGVTNEKNKNKVLRNLFLSEDWIRAMEFNYPCTNMYLLINKVVPNSKGDSPFFHPVRSYEHNKSVRCTTVRFLYDLYEGSCCLDLRVFSDATDKKNREIDTDTYVDDNQAICNYWYQAKSILKGFKDCYINKQSASDLF